jgi:hypothetical protein
LLLISSKASFFMPFIIDPRGKKKGLSVENPIKSRFFL